MLSGDAVCSSRYRVGSCSFFCPHISQALLIDAIRWCVDPSADAKHPGNLGACAGSEQNAGIGPGAQAIGTRWQVGGKVATGPMTINAPGAIDDSLLTATAQNLRRMAQ